MNFGLFGWKTHPGLRYKHKNSIFACKNFFSFNLYFSKKCKFATKKGIKNFLPKVFVFVYEKNADHTIFFYENFMISIFQTEIKILFLIVKMPSIIDIII